MSVVARQIIDELKSDPTSFQFISKSQVRDIVGTSYSTILYGSNGGLKKGDVVISGWGNGEGWFSRNISPTSIIAVYIKGQEIDIKPMCQKLENAIYNWLHKVPLAHLTQ